MYREALKWLMMSHTPTLSHQVYIYPPTILHTVGAPGSLSTRRHFHFKDSHTKLVAIWYVRLFHQGSPFGEQVGRRCKSNRKLEPLCPLSAFFFFLRANTIQLCVSLLPRVSANMRQGCHVARGGVLSVAFREADSACSSNQKSCLSHTHLQVWLAR